MTIRSGRIRPFGLAPVWVRHSRDASLQRPCAACTRAENCLRLFGARFDARGSRAGARTAPTAELPLNQVCSRYARRRFGDVRPVHRDVRPSTSRLQVTSAVRRKIPGTAHGPWTREKTLSAPENVSHRCENSRHLAAGGRTRPFGPDACGHSGWRRCASATRVIRRSNGPVRPATAQKTA